MSLVRSQEGSASILLHLDPAQLRGHEGYFPGRDRRPYNPQPPRSTPLLFLVSPTCVISSRKIPTPRSAVLRGAHGTAGPVLQCCRHVECFEIHWSPDLEPSRPSTKHEAHTRSADYLPANQLLKQQEKSESEIQAPRGPDLTSLSRLSTDHTRTPRPDRYKATIFYLNRPWQKLYTRVNHTEYSQWGSEVTISATISGRPGRLYAESFPRCTPERARTSSNSMN